MLVVGDADGRITVGGSQFNADPFSGRVTLDNLGNALGDRGRPRTSSTSSTSAAALGGGRVFIRDTGLGSGNDELINGTAEPDTITLDAVGTGSTRTGAVTFGDLGSLDRNIVTYRGIELVEIYTLGGTDTVLSNDTAVVTLIDMGGGDDDHRSSAPCR